MAIALLYWVLTASCWLYALKRGGAPARWAFISFMIGTAITMGAVVPPSEQLMQPWRGINAALFLADTFVLICYVAIALTAKRYWPIWSAGFQLVCVLTHMGPLLDPHSPPKIYRALEAVWALPMMITMVLGIRRDMLSLDRSQVHEPGRRTTAGLG